MAAFINKLCQNVITNYVRFITNYVEKLLQITAGLLKITIKCITNYGIPSILIQIAIPFRVIYKSLQIAAGIANYGVIN